MKGCWRLAGLCLVLPAWACAAAAAPAADPDPRPMCEPASFEADPFNPAAPRSARLETFAGWVAQGDEAPAFVSYMVGSHYRLGASHPAPLVEQDVAEARRWLGRAGTQGVATAMAAMAELELAHGDPMDAMVWAQIYERAERLQGRPLRGAYVADLLLRAFDALPDEDETQARIDEAVRDFLVQHGQSIREGLASAARGPDEAAGECRPIQEVFPVKAGLPRIAAYDPWGKIVRKGLMRPGMAMFRMTVAPSGKVVEWQVIDSLPDPAAAEALTQTVAHYKVNRVADEAPPRTFLIPIVFDDGSVRLRD